MPIIPGGQSFPGLDRLPAPLRGLIETLFPQDDPSQVMMAPAQVAEGKVAPYLQKMGRRITDEGSEAVQALLNLLGGEPSPVDPNKMFASEGKVMGSKIRPPAPLEVPQGFELPPPSGPTTPQSAHEALLAQDGFWAPHQSPENVYRQSLQDPFYQAVERNPPRGLDQSEQRLLGRWGRSGGGNKPSTPFR